MTTAPTHFTLEMARFAASFCYEQLTPAAIQQAKRVLLDSLGCALGGVDLPDVRALLEVLGETAGPGAATVIGDGCKYDPLSACLANALMVRVLDYNDIYWQQDPCHPSDLISAAIACCERQGSDGKELLCGIVLGHEFEMRMCEIAFPGIRERGYHHATLTGFVAPLVAGRMLGLDETEIQHAVGIAASHSMTLNAVTAGKLTMMKNAADPFAVRNGLLAALLAERGFTGPEHVLDGKEGLVQCLGPAFRLELLTEELGRSFRIERCGFKAYPTEALTHAPISALIELIIEHDLSPESVAEVEVRTLGRARDILADPSKYEPNSKETADHSLPYCIAAALVDREVTPRQFKAERIADGRIRAQLIKVKVVADPAIETVFPRLQRAVVNLRTFDGRSFSRQLDFPKGDHRNPLSDDELITKFDQLASPVLDAATRAQIIEHVMHLEQLDSVSTLMNKLKRRRGQA